LELSLGTGQGDLDAADLIKGSLEERELLEALLDC